MSSKTPSYPSQLNGFRPHKIWLHATKPAPKTKSQWLVARNLEELKALVKDRGVPRFVAFSNELNNCATGLECAAWLERFCTRTGNNFPRWAATEKRSPIVGQLLRTAPEMYAPDELKD